MKACLERNGEALSISTKNVKSDMPVVFKITLSNDVKTVLDIIKPNIF